MTGRKETPTEFVAKVSVKLPDFWTEDPDLWFLHAEAAFRNAQITQSKTKFDHIVQKLPEKIMVSVRGLIMGSAASSETPYEDIKAKLFLVYSIALAEGFQTNSPPWTGRPTPYRSHGRHVSPPPRGRETRLPVPGFISGEVTRRDEGPSSIQGIQKP